MFQSNLPFTREQSPIGEVTYPNNLTLRQWMNNPHDFTPGTTWNEDKIPTKDFMYGPNSKSTRYRLYNKGIVPTFGLPSLLYFIPLATEAQMVARGMYPPVEGVDMEEQADFESMYKYRFMEEMERRGVPEDEMHFRPE